MATTVTVTGAAGQIGYALLFRIASGQLLGPDTPVHLKLLEIPQAVKAAEGTALELVRLRLPAAGGHRHLRRRHAGLRGHEHRAAPVALSPAPEGHGARRPARGQRWHLKPQGEAIAAGAAEPEGAGRRQPGQHQRADRDEQRTDGVPNERFTAMTRLDHNRAVAQLAQKTGADGL